MIGTLDEERSSRQTSSPEPSGSPMSSRTRSGRTVFPLLSPSATVCAISVWKPSRSSASASGVVIDSSSSTSRIVRFACAMGEVCPPARAWKRGRVEQRQRATKLPLMPSSRWSLTAHQNEYRTPFLSVAVRLTLRPSPRTRVFQVLPPPLSQKSCPSSPALRITNLTVPGFGLAESRIE